MLDAEHMGTFVAEIGAETAIQPHSCKHLESRASSGVGVHRPAWKGTLLYPCVSAVGVHTPYRKSALLHPWGGTGGPGRSRRRSGGLRRSGAAGDAGGAANRGPVSSVIQAGDGIAVLRVVGDGVGDVGWVPLGGTLALRSALVAAAVVAALVELLPWTFSATMVTARSLTIRRP